MAVSDETKTLAREIDILHPKQFWEKLPELISSLEVEGVVVGLPLGIQGNDTEKTKEVREFAQRLSKSTGLPVELFDERFSSAMAQQMPGGNKNIDSLAAQIILQNYLDSRKDRKLVGSD